MATKFNHITSSIRVPAALAEDSADRFWLGYEYAEETGMEYEIHDVNGRLYVAAWHEDVGQVTWYTDFESMDEVKEFIGV